MTPQEISQQEIQALLHARFELATGRAVTIEERENAKGGKTTVTKILPPNRDAINDILDYFKINKGFETEYKVAKTVNQLGVSADLIEAKLAEYAPKPQEIECVV